MFWQEKTSQAADNITEKASEAADVAVAKGKEVGSFTKEVTIDIKDTVTNQAEKKKEEEEKKKKGRGPFGLF